MRVTITTTEPDEIKILTHANDMSLALYRVYSYLREQYKYADPPHDIEQIYEKFLDILGEYHVGDVVLD
jgi:hypothetical protein